MDDWLEARATARAFFREVRRLHECWDPTDHPVLQRSSAGVNPHALRIYAAEHGRVSAALAGIGANVAAAAHLEWHETLRAYSREKEAQSRMWRDVLDVLGHDVGAAPSETGHSVFMWTWLADDEPVLGLTVLYSLEWVQTSTARGLLTEQHGLLESCWRRQADEHHADALRRLLEPLIDRASQERALDAAEASFAAAWQILDGVERATLGVRA